MTEQQHPITPPQELLQQWRQEASIALNPTLDPRDYVIAREEWIATKAAQWGAANWQLEQVVIAWEDAFQSDLEHGVRSLNDRAARRLATEYPKIFAFGEVLAAMRPQQQQLEDNND